MSGSYEPHPPVRSEIQSDDVQRVREYLFGVYGPTVQLDCAAAGQQWRFSHVRHDAGGFVLEQISHSGDTAMSCRHAADAIVVWVHAGEAECATDRLQTVATRGELRLIDAKRGPVTVRLNAAKVTVVHLFGAEVGAGLTSSPRTAVVADALKRTITYTSDILHAGSDVAAPPVTKGLAGLLTAMVLTAFPDSAENDAGDLALESLPGALQAAMAYIADHAHRRINVSDVASKAFVTPRTLQYLFRRHLNTTPSSYLRDIRLRKARHELMTGDRASTTVSAAATRWGFGHTGRFAVLYRELYGESPHETLWRRR